MPINSVPQSDKRNSSLTVSQILVARKRAVTNQTFAANVRTGLLLASEIVSDDILVMDPDPIEIVSPLTGDGTESSPLSFGGVLTVPLHQNYIGVSAPDSFDLLWIQQNGDVSLLIDEDTQIYQSPIELAGVVVRVSNKYGTGTITESNPGEVGFTVHSPDGSLIPGTITRINLDGAVGPDYVAWGNALYTFLTPLAAGTPFMLRTSAPASATPSELEMRIQILGFA